MRLPLPQQFPDVDLPLEIVAATVVTRVQTGLPGVDLLVILPNNYGLYLIHGRHAAYCGDSTVEALVVHVHRETGVHTPADDTPVRTTGGPGLQGWADGAWLADALSTLARLSPLL